MSPNAVMGVARSATGVGIEGGMMTREDFALHWENIGRVLDRYPDLWADYYTKESIYEAAMEGSIQVWAFSEDGKIKMILFTRIVEHPASKVLHVLLSFGNSFGKFLPYIEEVMEDFGRVNGCGMCEMMVRDGWARKWGSRFKRRGVLLTAYPRSVH